MASQAGQQPINTAVSVQTAYFKVCWLQGEVQQASVAS